MAKRRHGKRKVSKRLTHHHRLPSSKGGRSTEDNISMVPDNAHRAWHGFALNYDALNIAKIINNHFIDPAYRFVCVKTEDVKCVIQFYKLLHE